MKNRNFKYCVLNVKCLLFAFIIYNLAFSISLAQIVAQPNVLPLDAKNGINKFKLCSFYDIHKANLKEDLGKKDPRIKWYIYTGNDIQALFDNKLKQINLGYYKNKLYKISVQFDETQQINADDIKNKLVLVFGEAKSADKKYVWETTKVYLSFEVTPKDISLNTYSKIIEKQIILDEL